MARIVVVLLVLAAGSATGAALFARGSQAAPQAAKVVRAALGPAPVSGPAALAEAAVTIQRTFVSTSGSDGNPCTRAQPCRSFAVALANTTAGGEVVALDSGGYGPFSIDKAVTIAGAPGAHVAISVFSEPGTGITVDIGSEDMVVLRNLYLSGLGGQTGIFFQAGGSLHVESVVAGGFTGSGLSASAVGGNLVVRDSVFRHNAFEGVLVNGSLGVEIADTRADRNGEGFAFGSGARGSISRSAATRNTQFGFFFQSGAVFAVSDSLADGNTSSGVAVFDDGTRATLNGVVLSNSSFGLLVAVFSPVARIGGSTVTGNGVGLNNPTTGTLETFGDNLVRGNTTDTSGTITAVGKT